MIKKILVLWLVIILPFVAFADVAVEGEVDIEFKITNISDYPDYSFFVKYQTYYYEYGYQPGEVTESKVAENVVRSAGARGSKSYLYARDKEGKIYESEIKLGGQKIISDRRANSIVEAYKIKSIKDGKINLKLEEKYLDYGDGKTKKISKGAVSGTEMFGVDVVYVAIPAVCLLLLVGFFMFRKKKSASA